MVFLFLINTCDSRIKRSKKHKDAKTHKQKHDKCMKVSIEEMFSCSFLPSTASQMIKSQQTDEDETFCQPVTLIALVRITVPVTDKKCPTSRDLGIVSLVNSGHTGRPTQSHTETKTMKAKLLCFRRNEMYFLEMKPENFKGLIKELELATRQFYWFCVNNVFMVC